MYGEDVHLDSTKDWAESVGIGAALAKEIAIANQSMDESSFTNPLNPISYLDLSGWLFHFRSSDYALVGLRQAISIKDPVMFGRFLHVWQDTYSHEGLNPLTHAIKGKSPDKYVCNSERDTDMRESTIMWLELFKENYKGKIH